MDSNSYADTVSPSQIYPNLDYLTLGKRIQSSSSLYPLCPHQTLNNVRCIVSISLISTALAPALTEEDMSEALPCRSPNEAQLNIPTNEVRAQNIFQHRPAAAERN